jgi:hypothetical protein
MKIPHIMPFQLEPFNGDTFIEAEFILLKNKFGLNTAFETGTCFASSTLFLSENFDRVVTIENNIEYLNIAHQRLKEAKCTNVKTVFGDSQEVTYDAIIDNLINDKTMFFLDAHFNSYCPLRDELKAIALAGIKPVIAIHDFKVPEQSGLGFDSYNGQDFELAWIFSDLNEIYGQGEWNYHYNTEENSAGAKRGIIYIYGKIIN